MGFAVFRNNWDDTVGVIFSAPFESRPVLVLRHLIPNFHQIKPDLHPLDSTDLTGPHLYPGSADDDRQRGIPQNHAVYERTTGDMMSERGILTADLVFIHDTEEAGASRSGHEMTSPMYHVTPASPQSENTSKHEAAGTTSMETTVNKHGGISQRRCHASSGHAEVSSGYLAHRTPDSLRRPLADVLSNSSKESLLSEDSDQEKSWSTMRGSAIASPASFSRTVSPCSSVRSGAFTPSIIQIKKHFLAPGSSLLHIPQTCFSSCESLSSSVCPQSPPPAPRHRPPLTRLSLLTAILRKGRLPILSPALQRPYTPCWPMNPVTLSFCNACSAASSVASIPLEFSSRFSSSASIDSQNYNQNRAITSPILNEHSRACPQIKRIPETVCSSTPTWERVRSPPPPPVRTTVRPLAPQFCSKIKSVFTPKREETAGFSDTLQSNSPELKRSNLYVKGREDNSLKSPVSKSPKAIRDQEPLKCTRQPKSSLSKLQWLSQQLRSPSACSTQPSPSPAVRTETLSPLPHTTQRCTGSERNYTPSHSFHKTLSPSSCTPVVSSGWPTPINSPTPSPAPPIRDYTPSPSLSLRSTPSPRPGSGISDCGDREGKKRKPHKIKSSYKSLAAIPTNTLLLDQQAIDEQVERAVSPCDMAVGIHVDTHAEMCSPAQLRLQSQELYAEIDEILANSNAPEKSEKRASWRSNLCTELQNDSSIPKSLGRETKYASLGNLLPSAGADRKTFNYNKTKPGVIRPMTAIPRLTVEDEEEFHHNPFKQYFAKTDRKKADCSTPRTGGKTDCSSALSETLKDEEDPGKWFAVRDLQITEPGDAVGQSSSHSGACGTHI
ncbi:muscular LMNA-interacting protein isoform X1 [Synchiropus splendidus]|uniref:muscular LMNA-interacting protein isoform X1 n=2 Tax=Synchiropus splendidus TaxID=270530 RepID=UPI00237D8AB1|nr:muscular LMNA-interacting protein isoform X1 [Synchiropus splendidus]